MADPSSTEGAKTDLAATSARQGRFGKPVFLVLVVSTVLAVVGIFAAWAWKAPDLAKPGSQQAVSAPSVHAPEPAVIVPPPGTDHTAPNSTTPQSR